MLGRVNVKCVSGAHWGRCRGSDQKVASLNLSTGDLLLLEPQLFMHNKNYCIMDFWNAYK